MDTQKTYGGGYPGSTSTLRILLDPVAGEMTGGSAAGTTATATPPPTDTSARVRPELDLSGVSAEDLSAAPDIRGGETEATQVAAATGTPQTPADPNIAASRQQAQTPAPQQAQQPTLRDAARMYGIDLSGYQDDASAFAALVRQAQASRQDDYYTQLGRQLAPQHQQIRQYLQQQQAPAQPERPSYQPPEFDERWLNFVDRDEQTGIWKAKPGIDPSIAQRVNDYSDWMAKFQRNPYEFIQPAIATEAKRIAEETVRAQFAQQQQQTAIQTIMDQNAPWLYQADEQGQRYVDANGRFIPTPAGARYQYHLQSLGQAGVRDPHTLNRIACQLVRADFASQTQTPAPTNAAAPPPTRAAVARPNVNSNQAVEPARQGIVAGATQPETGGNSLAALLRQALAESGITDADLARSVGDTYGS